MQSFQQIIVLRADKTVAVCNQMKYQKSFVPIDLCNIASISYYGSMGYAHHCNGDLARWSHYNYMQANFAWKKDVKCFAPGLSHIALCYADGSVEVSGQSLFGQQDIPPGCKDVVKVAAGSYHSLALTKNGTVLAWGHNRQGQCDVPVGLTDVVDIVAAYYHSMALKADGTAVIWGNPLTY